MKALNLKIRRLEGSGELMCKPFEIGVPWLNHRALEQREKTRDKRPGRSALGKFLSSPSFLIQENAPFIMVVLN